MAPRDDVGEMALFGLGHNGGPPLDPGTHWRAFCWRKAHAKAWKTPPREIALARLKRAEELGITYREYTSMVLDKGVHLQPMPVDRGERN